mgnify:CR=1 FL=1
MELVIEALEAAVKSAEWNVDHYTKEVEQKNQYLEDAKLKLANRKIIFSSLRCPPGPTACK